MSTSSAVLSEDGHYRYRLTRWWGHSSRAATFVMLNPSTADAETDDPTIRRCIGFARTWGYVGLVVVNLYAYRSTDPRNLWTATDPIGPENNSHLRVVFAEAQLHGTPVVAAWGAHAASLRAQAVQRLAAEQDVPLMCLGLTKAGAPRHPLYIRADTEPMLLRSAPEQAGGGDR